MIRRGAQLREESLAAIVLDASRESFVPQRSSRQGGRLSSESLAAIVLGAKARSPTGRAGFALSVTSVVYGCFGVAVLGRARPVNDAGSSPRTPLQVEHVVDLPPAAPEAAEPPSPAPRLRAPKVAAPVPHAPVEARESPPAEAGQVVAADEPAPASLDFTAFGVATGRGLRYAGGVTAASGNSTRAVTGAGVAHEGAQPHGKGSSLSRPVGAPRNGDWGCPWPSEAAGLGLDEQIVVLRAVVRADGSVASVALSSDPGFGFGPVAIACARRQQFSPATDEQGRPILATSPPIRFRFTRGGTL